VFAEETNALRVQENARVRPHGDHMSVVEHPLSFLHLPLFLFSLLPAEQLSPAAMEELHGPSSSPRIHLWPCGVAKHVILLYFLSILASQEAVIKESIFNIFATKAD